MAKERTREDNCNAIARILKDFCSCSENGAWSPDMTSDRKGPFLKSELTNMSGMRRRLMTIAKRKNKEVITEPPKLNNKTERLTANLINHSIGSQKSTIRRNIDNYLTLKRMGQSDDDESIYEKPIQVVKNSSYGENWSLSKSWKNNNMGYFNHPTYESNKIERSFVLERIDEVPKKKKRQHKEQLRYDKNIKRHIRIRVMLSLRMRRYVKKRLKKQRIPNQNTYIPTRKFIRGSSSTSSFGTRSYRSVMTDKISDGTVLFDILEARNSTMELCHDYEEDLDTLDVALRAGNFRYV